MQWPPTSPGWNGRKFHLVPAAASTSHIDRPSLREDLRDLVHEGDVDVALGVLDHLGRFGGLDRGGAEDPAAGHRAVDLGELLERPRRLAGDHLGDLVDRMLAVARIDPLGGVAEEEIAAALEAGQLARSSGPHISSVTPG